MKNRVLNDILIACSDNLTGMSEAIQLVYSKTEHQLCIVHQNGKVHYFQILKNSNLEFSEKTIIIGDLGYQGIQNIYKNTILPIKKTKNKKLTKQ
ncbi:hypothetical protein SAP269_05240 [Spiroplasma ixodetis]|uniref:Transposase n=1 Tax=Spiroplasma ixodetis TaxID=2141 RepID=A0ABM8JP36_9MOLU